MKKLMKPTDSFGNPFNARNVYALCVSDTENDKLKQRYIAASVDIENAARDFDMAAERIALHSIPRGQTVGSLTKKELINVYTYRMLNRARPGRAVYDRIIASVPNQRCPLCDIGVVSSLDHHLPKSEYPTLAVVPNNLVPVCRDCQDEKETHYPTSAEEHTLHPYFDDYESIRWLAARVIQTAPPAFEFFVNPSASRNAVELARFNTHMRILKLQKLYASNAGSELVSAQRRLHRAFVNGGPGAVRDDCLIAADDYAEISLNSWRSAMYAAAADSDWFCQGGFMAGNTGLQGI